MMKRYSNFWIIFLSVLVSCHQDASEIPTPVEMLQNSDIESPISGNWGASSSGGSFSMKVTDSESNSPSHSLMISDSVNYPQYFSYWYQKYTGKMPVGRNLTLFVRIKGENITGQGVSIAIRSDRNTEQKQFVSTQSDRKITGTFNWKEYSVELPDLDTNADAVWVFLVFLQGTTGKVYFDDINLVYK
jgi:hypothetical protein